LKLIDLRFRENQYEITRITNKSAKVLYESFMIFGTYQRAEKDFWYKSTKTCKTNCFFNTNLHVFLMDHQCNYN